MMICAKFGGNWFSDFGEEVENVKKKKKITDRRTQRRTDLRWTKSDQKS